VLVFKDTSAQACTLQDYPGVAMLDAAGHQAAQAVRTMNGYVRVLPPGQARPIVTLTTGQAASAIVEGSDVTVGNERGCPTYPRLLVTPPNTFVSVTIDMAMPGCIPVQVHPVVPGTTGTLVT
jgi:hypothetical protein